MITRSKHKSPPDSVISSGDPNHVAAEEKRNESNKKEENHGHPKSSLDLEGGESIPKLNIQLYASEYDTTTNLDAYGRSKRQVKQVIRFEPCHYSYENGRKRQLLSGPQGTGFNCPQCYVHLSYDAKQCFACNTKCKYSPGVGPIICRDRDSFLKAVVPMDENRLYQQMDTLDNPLCFDGRKRKVSQDEEVLVNTFQQSHRPSYGNTPWKSPLDVAECEVCLKLFPMSYLNGHRLKLHQLSSSEYGCPYCTITFSTMGQRLEHIHRKHQGQSSSVDADIYDHTRCYLYICCECQVPLHYTNLKYHLKHEHNNMDIFSCLDRIKTICPYCNDRTFHLTDDLLSHVKDQHPGALIIGKRLPIGLGKKTSTLQAPHPCESKASAVRHESLLQLSTTKLIHGLDLGINTRRRSLIPDNTTRETIDSMIVNIGNSIQTKNTKDGLIISIPGDDAEGDYISERKLFLKGVRDRSQKAEREALEKMKFKDNWDQTHRKLIYESRGTKKSAYELELDELINRPILYGNETLDKMSIGTKQHKCDLCSSCIPMCDGISSAYDTLIPGYIDRAITSPCFSSFDNNDSLRNDHSIIPFNVFDDNNGQRNRRLQEKCRLKMDMLRLLEVKNGLTFIEVYNRGLIADKRKPIK